MSRDGEFLHQNDERIAKPVDGVFREGVDAQIEEIEIVEQACGCIRCKTERYR